MSNGVGSLLAGRYARQVPTVVASLRRGKYTFHLFGEVAWSSAAFRIDGCQFTNTHAEHASTTSNCWFDQARTMNRHAALSVKAAR